MFNSKNIPGFDILDNDYVQIIGAEYSENGTFIKDSHKLIKCQSNIDAPHMDAKKFMKWYEGAICF